MSIAFLWSHLAMASPSLCVSPTQSVSLTSTNKSCGLLQQISIIVGSVSEEQKLDSCCWFRERRFGVFAKARLCWTSKWYCKCCVLFHHIHSSIPPVCISQIMCSCTAFWGNVIAAWIMFTGSLYLLSHYFGNESFILHTCCEVCTTLKNIMDISFKLEYLQFLK